MTRLRTALLGALLALLVAPALASCSSGPRLDDVLPAAGVSGDTIAVTADFDEALNLAQGAVVKVDGVDSGRVTSVTARDFRARVTFDVSTAAGLRRGASARLRYTTPLGELFVDVSNPATGPLLRDGAVLGRDRTSTAPTVEDTLSQASLLVNGGGLAQLQTITEELDAALGGREQRIRGLLDRTNRVLGQANATTADLDRALRSLASVSRLLRSRQSTVDAALRDVQPAARVLRDLTPDLTRLLAQLDAFAGVANQTVEATRANLLASLRSAASVLRTAADAGPEYRASLESLVTLDKALAGVVPGDYLNLGVKLRLDGLNAPARRRAATDLVPVQQLALRRAGLDRLDAAAARGGVR
ncbi:MCE family protein [Nocardioides sp. TRM66260-LWL]|uniref:MCE family protein n=1 Tax=Nocardioides sp. TRM66260-LWL TaxID=2874478 RepID=UPI001CC7917F|nr:MCE family protein [Nocardioides sp. TRM66260-LWL]MBZ5736288.1 MCE family protein [Nocardioides sp. TRM66260-LWL]